MVSRARALASSVLATGDPLPWGMRDVLRALLRGGAVSPWAYGYLDPAQLGRPLLLTDVCDGPSTLIMPRGTHYVHSFAYSPIELVGREGHAQLVVRPEPLLGLHPLVSDGLVKVVSNDSLTRRGSDIVQCDCGSIACGADSDDMRCVEYLSPDDFAAGRTLCPQCRPPDCLAISRGRRIATTIAHTLRHLRSGLDPPLDFEVSRKRHISVLLRNADAMCHCRCEACVDDADEPWPPEEFVLRSVMGNPHLEVQDR